MGAVAALSWRSRCGVAIWTIVVLSVQPASAQVDARKGVVAPSSAVDRPHLPYASNAKNTTRIVAPAQEQVALDADAEDAESDEDERGWAAIPFVFAQRETSVAFGAAGLYYFDTAPEAENPRTSDLRGAFTYTLRHQWSINVHPHMYFGGDRHFWDLKVQFKNFPERFWGVGNDIPSDHEVFLSQALLVRSEADHLVAPNLYVGSIVELESTTLSELEQAGQLASGSVFGSDGGFINSLGVKLTYDNRVGSYFPRGGGRHQLSYRQFHRIFGSDYNFGRVNLDSRQYIATWRDHVLALQTYLDLNVGDVPFYRLSLMGGSRRMRGYYEGRFRDNHQILFQLDYRIPIWGRWGTDVFFSVGEVFGSFGELSVENIEFTGGGGIRFAINEERFNIRVDVGAGPEEWGAYLNVGEAF